MKKMFPQNELLTALSCGHITRQQVVPILSCCVISGLGISVSLERNLKILKVYIHVCEVKKSSHMWLGVNTWEQWTGLTIQGWFSKFNLSTKNG